MGPPGVDVNVGTVVGEGVAVRITRTVGIEPGVEVGIRDVRAYAVAVALATTARWEALDIQTAIATTRNPTAMAAQAVHAGVLGCSDEDLLSLGIVGS